MFASKFAVAFSIIGCLLAGVAWSATPGMSASAGQHVAFSAAPHGGEFTIECSPNPGFMMESRGWIADCNRMARAAIDQAVSGGIIAPVTTRRLVDASEVPSECELGHHEVAITYVRRIPLRRHGA